MGKSFLVKSEVSDSFVTARIISFEEAIFFEVDFGDGTYSDDMLPEDLIVNV
jgi:hypothetical protein